MAGIITTIHLICPYRGSVSKSRYYHENNTVLIFHISRLKGTGRVQSPSTATDQRAVSGRHYNCTLVIQNADRRIAFSRVDTRNDRRTNLVCDAPKSTSGCLFAQATHTHFRRVTTSNRPRATVETAHDLTRELRAEPRR